MSLRMQMRYMNPYDIHKALINDYILKRPGDTRLLQRDNSKDKTDYDVIKENHKFLWNDEIPDTWETQFAKKYYDKLFKEYCIGDLSRYKENKIALRWRIEKEVVLGKGQFICANKICSEKEKLRTWEVNFAYQEKGEKKNALVKIRLCPDCSIKLNYHSKKREVKRSKHKSSAKTKVKQNQEKTPSKKSRSDSDEAASDPNAESSSSEVTPNQNVTTESSSPWDKTITVETKSRDEEMEEYLQDLLL